VVVISDLHLGKVQDTIPKYGMPSRLYDARERVMEAMLYASKRKESLIIAGDVFDNASPNPITITTFFDILGEATGIGLKVYIIAGNHDCSVNYFSMMYLCDEREGYPNVMVIESPNTLMVDGMKVLFLPHVMKSVVDAQGYQEWVLDRLSDDQVKGVDVVIGHAHLAGAKNSSDIEIEAGDAVSFNPSKFYKYKLGIFGHIHRHQVLGKNWYCGSVVTNSFDEAEIEKGFVHVARPSEPEFVPYVTPETEYRTINIDLVNKDTLVFDPKKMTKLAKDKLLKLVVFAKDIMQVNQTEIRRNFDEYGTVVRFETVISDKYNNGETEEVSDVFEIVNYKEVFKRWVKEKPEISEESRKELIKIGYSVIEEVINAERN